RSISRSFEKLANDEDHKPANDVACRRQVSGNRLNRFKQNNRHDEQQSRIWANRHNSRSQAFENPAIRQPAKDRFEETEKDGVHQEVDGGDQKHEGFEYAAQIVLHRTKARTSIRFTGQTGEFTKPS